jgi:hypothetical protein
MFVIISAKKTDVSSMLPSAFKEEKRSIVLPIKWKTWLLFETDPVIIKDAILLPSLVERVREANTVSHIKKQE